MVLVVITMAKASKPKFGMFNLKGVKEMTYNNYIIIDKNGKTATVQDNRGRLRTAFNSFEVACEIRSVLNKSKTKPRMLKSELKIKFPLVKPFKVIPVMVTYMF